MSPLAYFDDLARVALPARPLHLAIGMFDGVHLGHQSVIESAIHSARRSGGLAGVLTFWPHPSALFRPDQPTRLLMPRAMKRRVLANLGLDFVIEQNFSREFAAIEAAEFVPTLRRSLPQLAALYVGENWRFGRGRSGDVALLNAEAKKAGVAVFSASHLNHNGAPISSSRIRELLASGAIADANALLGYTYFSTGPVTRGKQLGRTIGFPTLNQDWEPELKPRFGVYAVTVDSAKESGLRGVASYGVRPTVADGLHPLLEVHVLGPTTVTYGDEITVHWRHFFRPEEKFENFETMRRQIERDRDAAVKYFADLPSE